MGAPHEAIPRPLAGDTGDNAGKPHERSGNIGTLLSLARQPAGLDFAGINRAALASLPSILARWLPDGRREGGEWVARNPRRADRRPGSFSVNLATGRWSDFATGDKGGDVVSLAAYLAGTNQGEAARSLATMLGVR